MFEWLHKVNVRIYAAQQMTGVKHSIIYQRNAYCNRVFTKYGITVLSPVTEEGVKSNKKKLNQPSQEALRYFWKRDKWLIRNSHILVDITGPSKSQGLLHEIGLSRYFYFKPIVRVMKLQGPSVALEEEDLIAPTVEKAAKFIIGEFGTPWKRLKWKFKLFGRCFPGYLRTRIAWWFDWI
jgi:hypothetical protein